MRDGLKNLNVGLSFLLELAALGVLGLFGYRLDVPGWGKVLAAMAIPAVVILLWARLAAPRAANRLSGYALLAFKIVVFGAAVLALYALGYRGAAVLLAAFTALNLALEFFIT